MFPWKDNNQTIGYLWCPSIKLYHLSSPSNPVIYPICKVDRSSYRHTAKAPGRKNDERAAATAARAVSPHGRAAGDRARPGQRHLDVWAPQGVAPATPLGPEPGRVVARPGRPAGRAVRRETRDAHQLRRPHALSGPRPDRAQGAHRQGSTGAGEWFCLFFCLVGDDFYDEGGGGGIFYVANRWLESWKSDSYARQIASFLNFFAYAIIFL